MVKIGYLGAVQQDLIKDLVVQKLKGNKEVASRLADMALLLMEKELRNRLSSTDDLGLKNRTEKIRQMSDYLSAKSRLMGLRKELGEQMKALPQPTPVPIAPIADKEAAEREVETPEVKAQKQKPPKTEDIPKGAFRCPKCKYEMQHKTDVEAETIECPKCNTPMKRKLPVL